MKAKYPTHALLVDNAVLDSGEFDRLEAWVCKNSTWFALTIISTAFALQFAYANWCYLNPDEAAYFRFARPNSWHGAYEGSLLVSHPPIFLLILHGMLLLGRNELILRLPSLIGGTVALWFAFAWLRRSLGEITAIAGLLVMALSPAAVSASSEVRPYGLLLCFVCCSLYATERMFSDCSFAWTVGQGCFLLAAMLTHYTAIVAVASICAYTLLRSYLRGVPRRILSAIIIIQVVIVAVLVWQYFGVVRGAIPFGPGLAAGYLRPYFYNADRETPIGFVWRMLTGTFLRVAGRGRSAFITIPVFLAGLTAILAGRTKAQRLFTVLIISPFIVGLAGGVLEIFPFAGSRHQSYLVPFVAAGLSASLAWVHGRLAVRLLLAATVIAVPFKIIRIVPDNDRRIFAKRDMTSAIEYLRRTITPGTPLLVDIETRETLEYYLAKNDKDLEISAKRGVEEWLGGYRVVTPRELVWAFRATELPSQAANSAQELGLHPGDPFWVVSASWLDEPLASRLSTQRKCAAKEFGRISVIETGCII
jgi:hypothetical protein